MNYNPSYITKIETGSQPPTHDFANTADEVLRAGGALFRAWREYDGSRKDATRSTSGHREPERVVPEPGSSGSLIVDHDDAELTYGDDMYHAKMRRHLFNGSDTPITQYLIGFPSTSSPPSPNNPTSFTGRTLSHGTN